MSDYFAIKTIGANMFQHVSSLDFPELDPRCVPPGAAALGGGGARAP